MTDLEKKFLTLLQSAAQQKASDVHLSSGTSAAVRMNGKIVIAPGDAYSAQEILGICQLMTANPNLKASDVRETDGSFEVKGLGRFRFNIFKTTQGLGAVLRIVAKTVPTLDDLRLPAVVKRIAESERGLVLVTGATGSGKSTTLAAMIEHLNSTQSLHIVTVEDPVEFTYESKNCRFSQRELGRDTGSYASALKAALRQDPDVILVGELRDLETLDVALKAAETGHLVFSTAHTSDAMKTIGRLISMFPPEAQAGARVRLADNLHAIISQRMVNTLNGKVVAQEILINNLGIQECLADETKTFEIPSFIERGKDVAGMQTFDQHLVDLVRANLISMEDAMATASNPADFQRNMAFGASAGMAIEDNSSSFQTKMEVVQEVPLQDTDEKPVTHAAPKPAGLVPPPSMPKPPMPNAAGTAGATKTAIKAPPKIPGAA